MPDKFKIGNRNVFSQPVSGSGIYYPTACMVSSTQILALQLDYDNPAFNGILVLLAYANGEWSITDTDSSLGDIGPYTCMCAIDTDKAIIFYSGGGGANELWGVWVDCSSGSITVKTDVQHNSPAGEDKRPLACCKADTDKAVVMYYNDENPAREIYVIGAEPSGNNVAFDAVVGEVQLTGANGSSSCGAMEQITTDKIIAAWLDSNNNNIETHYITVNALACTDSDQATAHADAGVVYDLCCVEYASNVGTILMSLLDADADPNGEILTIDIDTSQGAGSEMGVWGGSQEVAADLDLRDFLLTKVATGEAIFVYIDNATDDSMYAGHVTESGGSLTVITPEQILTEDCLNNVSSTSLFFRASSGSLDSCALLFVNNDVSEDTYEVAEITYQGYATATGYCKYYGSSWLKLRLVATADADYSSLRVYQDSAWQAADCVKANPPFTDAFPIRVYHDTHGWLCWRDDSIE